MKFEITKEWLRENNACQSGYEWFCNQTDTDCAAVMRKLNDEGRFGDVIWVFRHLANQRQAVLLSIFCAEMILTHYEIRFSENTAPRQAIDAAKEWLKNPCEGTRQNAVACAACAADAAAAAYAVAYAADAADAAAYAAADAADATAYATGAAAYAAAYAAYAAAYATGAVAYADYAAYAAYAADAAAYEKIIERTIMILGLEED
jgi:hypothetical protein